jgi:hypothetical protein
MARQRYVYPTGEIPHKWAHQTQESARNPQGNLYFHGDTIYSYRDSWPLGRLYRHAKRGVLVLTNSDRYSATTNQHQGAVDSAVRHLRAVAVPHCTRDTYVSTVKERDASNVRYLEQLAAENLTKAQRAMQARTVAWRRSTAQEALADAADYRRFFGMRGKIAEMPTAAWDAALARAQRIENPDPASADARQRAAAKRKARQEEKMRVALDNLALHIGAARSAWRLGEPLRLPAHPLATGRAGRWRHRVDGGPVMLRVNAEEIETSQGARIPLSHAPRLWRIIEAVRASGQPYVRNGHTVHAGEFAIDRIDPDGTLRAGCHTIPHSELRIMARALGLPCEVQP